MPSRLWRAAAILAPSLLLAGLGTTAAAAAATTSAPTLVTTNFACSSGTCEVGPGNVGVPFGAALGGTGGPPTSLPDCPYIFSVVSGSLPPGLQLGGVCTNIIGGTPAQAGTYPFTVKVQSLGSDTLGVTEPSSTQQLTITIGTGQSDRLVNLFAGWNLHTRRLFVGGYDANAGALYSVSLTATGTQIIAPEPMTPGNGGDVALVKTATPDPCSVLHVNSCSLTVTDSLGSSVTVTLPAPKY
jgi:hypothetical protein